MSNPFCPPKSSTAEQLLVGRTIGQAYFRYSAPEWKALAKERYSLDAVRAEMERLGLHAQPTFVIPQGLTFHKHFQAKPRMATAANSGFDFKARSWFAVNAVYEFTIRLSGDTSWCLPDDIRNRGEMVIYASGNPEHTIDRWQYLQKKPKETLVVPTAKEVADAMAMCGLVTRRDSCPLKYVSDDQRSDVLHGRGLVRAGVEPEEAVTWNLTANAGYPWLVPLKTEGVAEAVVKAAVQMEEDVLNFLRRHGGPVRRGNPKVFDYGQADMTADRLCSLFDAEVYSKWIEEKPYMAAVQGKCKTDFYKEEKLAKGGMRFYNVVPAHMGLIMKQATQVFERQAQNLLDDPESYTSAQGVSFAYGGADHFVDALEIGLNMLGVTYTHVGDDSLCFVRAADRSWMVCVTVDLTCFDLTQDRDVTAEVDRQFFVELAQLDTAAALVWHAYRRKRLTVMAHTLPALVRNGGPSGLMLQSKVNDVLAEILWARIYNAMEKDGVRNAATAPSRDYFDVLMRRECKRLGFVGRLESYSMHPAETILEFLRLQPVLFIGYYLHVRKDEEGNEQVVPFADPPRTLAQVRYPSIKWVRNTSTFMEAERVRVASTVMSMGIPPRGEERPFAKLMAIAREGLDEVRTLRLEAGSFLLAQPVAGPDAPTGVEGLKNALARASDVWLHKKELSTEEQSEQFVATGALGKAFNLPVVARKDPANKKNAGRRPSTYFERLAEAKAKSARLREYRQRELTSARERRRDAPTFRDAFVYGRDDIIDDPEDEIWGELY